MLPATHLYWGAKPVAAQAIVTSPEGPHPQQEETLFQLLSGGLDELRQMGATLTSGHEIEDEQLTIRDTILAEPHPDELCNRSNLPRVRFSAPD